MVALAIWTICCGGSGGPPSPVAGGPTPAPTPTPDADPLLAAAGDIACGGATPAGAGCKQLETSDLLVEVRPSVVLALGDLQYEYGEYAEFLRYYDVSWGRAKPITRPAPGNHEYESSPATGYFDYWNGIGRGSGVAGNRGEGWYSFDVGSWHVVSLNSNCEKIAGGCGASSPQVRFLRADLEANRAAACTLAFWHHPRFGSGNSRSNTAYQAFWEALYDANADLVIVAHDHSYERFAPQTPTGQLDRARGLRQIVVGTGGHSLHAFFAPLPNSEVRYNQTYGVLQVRLRPRGYEWLYRTIAGSTFTDSGSDVCH